jgi:cytochrome b involved in lipid metabolism
MMPNLNETLEHRRDKYFTWKEIRNSNSLIVIDNFVYDVANFRIIHPGGEEIIRDYITQDASVYI